MAQSVPQLINYQGILKTTQPLTTIKLEFNIYNAATGGTKVWGPQIFNNVPVVQGKFNVILGSTDTIQQENLLQMPFLLIYDLSV